MIALIAGIAAFSSIAAKGAVAQVTIKTQPKSVAVAAGQTATFTATASVVCRSVWYKNGSQLAYGPVAQTVSYTTPATTAAMSGTKYSVKFYGCTGKAGTVLSQPAVLSVGQAQTSSPVITTQPTSQTVALGHAATFRAAATGSSPLHYQWHKNGTAVSGATAASYTTPATTSADNDSIFQVSVSNSIGSTTSNSASLTVTSGSAGNAMATVIVTPIPGRAIPSNFGGISTFDIEDDGDLMGNSSKGYNPIYRELIKNLIFPGQKFVITSEDDTGAAGGVGSVPSASQVTALGQLYLDMSAAGYSIGIMPGVAGLCTGNEALAKAYGQAWISHMPSGSILGMVMGNEPDGPCGLDYSTYFSRFQQYTSDIRSMSGGAGMKFMGPQFGGQIPWVDTAPDMNAFISSEHSILSAAGQHWYALNGCSGSPSISALLAPSAATDASSVLPPFIATAHANGTTLRISEMNSIDCGGRSGISDTFAAALWVMDGLFNLASVGVDGVNIFSDEGDNYDLFGFTSTSAPYHVSFIRPEYYGLLVFQQATQNGARLLPLTLNTSKNVVAWATIDSSGVARILVINKDESASGDLSVVLAGFGNGTLSRLVAPSVSSKMGVTWAGRTFDGSSDGAIQGTLSTTTVTPNLGQYTFTLGPTSAALLSVSP